MTLNDKLKGEFYRAPITKLASRSTINTELDSLLNYFDSLSTLLETSYDRIDHDREVMVANIRKMYSKVLHFKYILDHYNSEIDEHITERLQLLINSFTSSIAKFVEPYELNLFNHLGQTDRNATYSNNLETLDEWNRSINMTQTDLGIRWFGGKLSDTYVRNNLSNILHIVKVNTSEGHSIEDYIGSNPILELFLYSSKGMYWIVLGQNATFDYNYIVKYQSKTKAVDLKVVSENFFNSKELDVNKFDIDLIINTLFNTTDIDGGNIYVKIKTNIPPNTESGREGYFLTSSNDFTTYEDRKAIVNTANKLMYHDNKDVAFIKKENNTIEDVYNEKDSFANDRPDLLVNPIFNKEIDATNDAKIKSFVTEISNKIDTNGNINITKTVKNPNNVEMKTLSDRVNGIVINNPDDEILSTTEEYFKNYKSPIKYRDNNDPVYEKGELGFDSQSTDDFSNTKLIAKNEISFESNGKVFTTNKDNYGKTSDKIITELNNIINLHNKTIQEYTYSGNYRDLVFYNGYMLGYIVDGDNLLVYNSHAILVFNISTKVPVLKNILTKNELDNVLITDMCKDSNGNIFITIKDYGIFKLVMTDTGDYKFVNTNITGGWFHCLCACPDNNLGTMFAIKDHSNLENLTTEDYYDTDNNRLVDTIYVYKNSTWKPLEQVIVDDNLDESYYDILSYIDDTNISDGISVLSNILVNDTFKSNQLVSSNKSNLIYDKFNNRYYLIVNNKLFVSDESNLPINFKFVDDVEYICIADDKLYYNNSVGIYKYDNKLNESLQLSYTDKKIINNRESLVVNVIGFDDSYIYDHYCKLLSLNNKPCYSPNLKDLISLDETIDTDIITGNNDTWIGNIFVILINNKLYHIDVLSNKIHVVELNGSEETDNNDKIINLKSK